jgi:hypothetical protein
MTSFSRWLLAVALILSCGFYSAPSHASPLNKAQLKVRQQQSLIDRSLKTGRITQEEYDGFNERLSGLRTKAEGYNQMTTKQKKELLTSLGRLQMDIQEAAHTHHEPAHTNQHKQEEHRHAPPPHHGGDHKKEQGGGTAPAQ